MAGRLYFRTDRYHTFFGPTRGIVCGHTQSPESRAGQKGLFFTLFFRTVQFAQNRPGNRQFSDQTRTEKGVKVTFSACSTVTIPPIIPVNRANIRGFDLCYWRAGVVSTGQRQAERLLPVSKEVPVLPRAFIDTRPVQMYDDDMPMTQHAINSTREECSSRKPRVCPRYQWIYPPSLSRSRDLANRSSCWCQTRQARKHTQGMPPVDKPR
jgi:hypothetical protein